MNRKVRVTHLYFIHYIAQNNEEFEKKKSSSESLLNVVRVRPWHWHVWCLSLREYYTDTRFYLVSPMVVYTLRGKLGSHVQEWMWKWKCFQKYTSPSPLPWPWRDLYWRFKLKFVTEDPRNCPTIRNKIAGDRAKFFHIPPVFLFPFSGSPSSPKKNAWFPNSHSLRMWGGNDQHCKSW